MPLHRQTRKALQFRDLMTYRIAEVLLVSAPYDAFILEQDGRLTEQVFANFSALNLSASPRFTQAPTGEAALELLATRRFDLVISMTRLADVGVNAFARRVKAFDPDLPVVLLALDRKQLHDLRGKLDRQTIDGVFLWSGDSSILLAVIKSVEDRKNVDSDIERGNVRVILVVEDSPGYYSSFLTMLYHELMKQARALYSEGVSEILRRAYVRSRPKILHATSYEEATELLERYHANMMAVICDLAFPRGGAVDQTAGIAFVRRLHRHDHAMPVLLQSATRDLSSAAAEIGAAFVDKSSPTLLAEIRKFLRDSLGFGDFVFRDGRGREIDRARDLRELETKIAEVPVASIYYHAARDHFSIWLQARSEFRLAEIIRPQKVSDFTSVESARKYLIDALRETREDNLRQTISDFNRRDFARDPFCRLGSGSLGGKARGIAFLSTLLDELEASGAGGLEVALPKTVVVTTDYFDHFLESNGLRDFAFTCEDDDEIRRRFLAAELSAPLLDDLGYIVEHLDGPLAVRSSSLLEDSMVQPLAGIYETLMVPNRGALDVRLRQVADALKLVYASTFSADAKSYLKSAGNRLEEEKMAVAIQALVGRSYGERYYPCFAGVARSYNFYPLPPQKAEDGIVHLALGLGRLVVDGGQALMFSPRHPGVLPQFHQTKTLLDHSQRGFYALDLEPEADDLFSTVRFHGLDVAERDGSLACAGSVFSADDQRLVEDLSLPGPRVVTFANVLRHKAIPLAETLSRLLEIGEEGFGCAVEIEFAGETGFGGDGSELYVLQIRPFAGVARADGASAPRIDRAVSLCASSRALGNGVDRTIRDVVYVRRDRWQAAHNRAIAIEIGEINQALAKEDRRYVLIGPGRWGTAEEWLGIPVQWSQISNVKLLVEASPAGYDVEVSQGAHFFHNITSLEIGYLSLPPGVDESDPSADDYLDWEWLESLPSHRVTEHLRWVRFDEPLTVVLDGRRSRGVIGKPDVTVPGSIEPGTTVSVQDEDGA